MSYLKFDLHHQDPGTMVEVSMSGMESNVYVVDDMNLRRLERGESFQHARGGGRYRRSPARMAIPSAGHWTAVVMPIGGRVQASVKVFGPVSA
jgi:hypothetical protein